MEPVDIKRDYGCVMSCSVNDTVTQIEDWVKVNINSDLLRGPKTPDRYHLTIRNGVYERNWRVVQKISAKIDPFTISFGEIKIFDHRPEYDVVYCSIDSPELHEAYTTLSQLSSFDLYEGFTPHITLAYVLPGSCNHLVGTTPFSITERIHWLSFVTKDGDDHIIRMARKL